uniref:BRX domain-containing protein n=1 Tax=Leersia perrieri TaxID=77586 RepID=A0A0D9W8Z4_9ORYZ
MCCLQLKDMVLKFSGGSNKHHHYKAAAGGSPSFRSRSYRRPYPGFIDDSAFMTTTRPGVEAMYTRASAAAAHAAPPVRAAASTTTWDMARSKSNRGWHQDDGENYPGSGAAWIHSRIEEEAGDGGQVVAVVEDAVPREWMAQVEPGVQITFVTLPGGGNDLKRIRFSREIFNKWEAQRWWGENYDRIVELYNVQTFSGRQQGVSTPTSSVDDSLLRESSFCSRGGSTQEIPVVTPAASSSLAKEPIARSMSCKAMAAGTSLSASACYPSAAVPDPSDHVWAHHFNMLNSAAGAGSSSAAGGGGPSFYDPSRGTTSSRDEASVSISNASDMEAAEWIEQDEPGVCLTIRELGDGTRELRRVRFSRERFGEDRAKVWWEQNRDRIQAQYL